MVAETDARSKGIIEAIVRSSINTSIAKTKAAIGALKMLAIVPAVAHPIRSILSLKLRCSIRAKFELSDEALEAAGASSPIEPPNPAVKIDEIIDEYI